MRNETEKDKTVNIICSESEYLKIKYAFSQRLKYGNYYITTLSYTISHYGIFNVTLVLHDGNL